MTEQEFQKAKEYLKKVDPILAPVIDKYQLEVRTPQENLFGNIIDSIISQQLSVKAAATIHGRFLNLFHASVVPTPDQILLQKDEDMRACGISFQKIKYIKGLALAVVNKDIDLEAVKTLPDEQVISELTKIKGIGKWTAEMILIFSLLRPDVFSVGDLGLRTAVSKLYNIKRDNLEGIEKISLNWSPYRSVASRYLWKNLDNK